MPTVGLLRMARFAGGKRAALNQKSPPEARNREQPEQPPNSGLAQSGYPIRAESKSDEMEF